MKGKIIRNTRLGIDENDIHNSNSKIELYGWSIELQKHIDELKDKLEDEKNNPNEKRKLEYALRSQGLMKQMVHTRLSILNQEEKIERQNRYERIFLKHAKLILPQEIFDQIHSNAMNELNLN